MKMPALKLLLLTASLSAVLVAHATNESNAVSSEAVTEATSQNQSIYIVGFKRPPLALADTKPGSGLDSLPRTVSGRLDVFAPSALNYVASLRFEQSQILDDLSNTIGRPLTPIAPEFQFQHAFNGAVVRLTESELDLVSRDPRVATIEAFAEYELNTDVGPALINAPSLWAGTGSVSGFQTKGENVVVGIIDSGINLGSPSYADIAGDGYDHTNPLGSGNYLGLCSSTPANCNDKLIGTYDFADAFATAAHREAPGVEDENGHGSHTAATTAGNERTANFNGVNVNLSGVAPRANIVAYDVCYTVISTGTGSCANGALIGAINQVVADGIIDVVNYSISGGTQPWLESTSLAFLAAHNAGIFVAASAGNSGPGPSTLGHLEPWVTSVGASTHNRAFGGFFSLTGPAMPPGNTQNIPIRMGATPWPAVATSGSLIRSPNFATGATDGCAAFPANTFRTGQTAMGAPGIAVLRLDVLTSACGSGTRRTNAVNAGAAGVIFVDTFFINLGANNTSWTMLLSDWLNIEAHYNTDPTTAAANITAPQAIPAQADSMAAFSSRGPGFFDLLKPDVSAPGVNILATFARWVAAAPAPFAGAVDPARNPLVGLNSGTSMSSPHVAGSAALLKSLNRSWTPTQIKTALVTTGNLTMTKEDGITPADPLDRGGGRVDLSKAAKVGLIMDETGANFAAANPATGGSPGQLNLPSFQELSCVGSCTFNRTVRSTRTAPVTWTLSISGLGTAASVNPSSFVIANAATQTFTLTIDSLQLPPGTNSFGTLTLVPSLASIPIQTMPIAVRPALPDIAVAPSAVTATVVAGQTGTLPVNIANVGNPTINWSIDNVGIGNYLLYAQGNNSANGFATGNYAGTPGTSFYSAEDISYDQAHTLRSIRAEGFMLGTGTAPLQTAATSITYKVYTSTAAPSPEFPAGNPDAGAGGEVWSCVRTTTGVNSAGLSFQTADGATFTLDLAAATGCPAPPALTANTRYWLAVYPQHTGTSTGRRWIWFRATTLNGEGARLFSGGTWNVIGSVPPALDALATTVTTDVQCGAPWLSATPTSGSLSVAGAEDTTLTFDATALAVGEYRGHLCVSTNGTDADEPKPVIPVLLNVVPAVLFSDGFED